MLILLTGPIQTGKTTACSKAVSALQANGVAVRGLLTPALEDAFGAKTGIAARDVNTGEQQMLARLVQPGEAATVGVYRMDTEVFAWVKEVLASALDAEVGWLVVDEIGPLELRRDEGFAFLLEPLADPAQTPNVVVIVREALVDELAGRLNRPDIVLFRVTIASRNTAPARLARLMRTGIDLAWR